LIFHLFYILGGDIASESLSSESQERAAISGKCDIICGDFCVLATPDFG
jgi:hypothetical protein